MIDWVVPEWALGFDSEAPTRVLAVIGAGAVGAFGIGALVQLLVRVAFAQKIPRWPIW